VAFQDEIEPLKNEGVRLHFRNTRAGLRKREREMYKPPFHREKLAVEFLSLFSYVRKIPSSPINPSQKVV
jgi:hypothetical protein